MISAERPAVPAMAGCFIEPTRCLWTAIPLRFDSSNRAAPRGDAGRRPARGQDAARPWPIEVCVRASDRARMGGSWVFGHFGLSRPIARRRWDCTGYRRRRPQRWRSSVSSARAAECRRRRTRWEHSPTTRASSVTGEASTALLPSTMPTGSTAFPATKCSTTGLCPTVWRCPTVSRATNRGRIARLRPFTRIALIA